jgi:hypothetical protein
MRTRPLLAIGMSIWLPGALSLQPASVLAGSILPAVVLSAGLLGCGSPEAAKAPAPVQVKWARSDGTAEPEAPAAESPSAAAGDPAAASEAKPGEVDLDELAARKEALAAKKAAAKPAPKPAPKEEPPPPPAPAVAAAPAAEPEPEPEVPAAPVPLGNEMHAALGDNQKPSPHGKKPAPKKAAAKPAAAEPAVAAYTGPNPCRTTHFSVPRVEQACAANGRAGAKGVMKDAIGKALAAGASLKCGDCHAEQKDYTLKKDAVAQLKKWLGP